MGSFFARSNLFGVETESRASLAISSNTFLAEHSGFDFTLARNSESEAFTMFADGSGG